MRLRLLILKRYPVRRKRKNNRPYMKITAIFLLIFFILTGCAPQKAETPINVSVGEAKIPVKVEKIDKIEVEPIIIPEKEEEIVSEPEVDPVREILDSLTIEQKIGQMFIVPLSGETLTEEDRNHLSERY